MQARVLSIALLAISLAAQSADSHRDTAKLKGESFAESLKKLSDVNLYQPPMYGGAIMHSGDWIPLEAEADQDDLVAIMSSWRFRQVFGHLSTMSKDAASEVVKRELSSAMKEYLPFYEHSMQGIKSPKFKAFYTNSQERSTIGVSFASSDVPEGEVVIRGASYRVLALAWTAGMLGLTGCKDEVERAARLAVKQRTELYLCDDPPLTSFFKAQMLKGAGLYNRRIIAAALLGVAGNPSLEAAASKAAGIDWQERPLIWSGGTLTARFPSPLDDAHFDIMLTRLLPEPPPGGQKQ